MAKRRSRKARQARIEARRRTARQSLVAGAGLVAFAAFTNVTGTLPGGVNIILGLIGLGLLIYSVMLATHALMTLRMT